MLRDRVAGPPVVVRVDQPEGAQPAIDIVPLWPAAVSVNPNAEPAARFGASAAKRDAHSGGLITDIDEKARWT